MRTQTPQSANHVVFCNTNRTNILGGDLAQWAHNNYQKTLILCTLRHRSGQIIKYFAYANGSKLVGGRPSPKGIQQRSKTLGFMRTPTPQWAKHDVLCNTNGSKLLGEDLVHCAHREDLAQMAHTITQKPLVLFTLRTYMVQNIVCFANTIGSNILGEDLAHRAHNSSQKLWFYAHSHTTWCKT